MRLSNLTLLVFLTLPAWGAEREGNPAPRPTVLDLRGLDGIDVEPFSGALVHRRVDLAIGDRHDSFQLARTWSAWGGDGFNFGFHWASALDMRVEIDGGGDRAVFIDESGFPMRFKAQGGGLRSIEGRPMTLALRDGGWTLSGRAPHEILRFDAEGRMLRRELHGRTVLSYRYRDGVLSALEGAWGTLDLVRDGEGQLVEIQGPGGLLLRYRRDNKGSLVEVARGRRYAAYSYDSRGRLSGIANGQGRIRYDRVGRVVALTGPGMHSVQVSYSESALGARSVVTRGSLVTECLRTHEGHRLERRFPNGALEVMTLDKRNRPRIRRLEGQRWTWEYDDRGRITRHGSPEGETKFRYGRGDRPTSINLPTGLVLSFRYDERGLLRAARHPAQGNLKARHDEQGRLLQLTDARGALTNFRYDDHGYLVEINDPSGRTRLVRSAAGELSEVHTPNGRVTRIDATGDQRRVSVRTGGEIVEQVAYDRRGRPTRRHESGRTIHYRWNLRGELLSARDAVGSLASFSYDSAGRIEAMKDGAGNEVRYRRPDAKTVVIEDPSTGRTTLRHDTLGRLVEEVRGGAKLSYTYDSANRLVSRTTPRGRESFVYGAQGRLIKLEGPDGGYRMGYDATGRMTRLENLKLGKAIKYRYSTAGDRVAADMPWGRVGYSYDSLGRLSGVTSPEGEKISFERLADGRRSVIRYPNGAVTRFTYDGSRLTRMETRKGTNTLALRAYTHDAHGAVSSVTDAKGVRTRYERDARGRLVTEIRGKAQRTYGYDGADNMLASKGVVGGGNRLQRAGTRRFRYDARGALVAVEGSSGTARYRYDTDGHLIEARVPKKPTVRYGYAPNGTRLWRQDGKGRTDYLHDLSDVVGEYHEGSLARSFVHGDGLDDVLSMRQGKRSYYYHYDQVRSVVALSDSKGRVAARYRYSAFGETTSTGSSVGADNPFRYTSRAQDSTTGLYHYRARTYDPTHGRFTSPDPYGHRGGMNLYAYALNDPTRFNDPWGLWPSWLDSAVNKVTDVVKSAATSVVSFAKSNPVTNAIYEGGKVLVSFGKGFGKGLYSGLKGFVNMFLHPIKTYEDIKWAINNWDQVKAALGDKWDDYKKAFDEGDWETVAEMTGYVMGEITAGFVGTKGIDKLAKLGAVRRLAGAAAATRPAQAVARTAKTVVGATAPVRKAAGAVLRPVGTLAKGAWRLAKPVRAVVRTAVKPFDWAAEKILNGAIWTGDRLTRPLRNLASRAGRGVGRRLGRRGKGVGTGTTAANAERVSAEAAEAAEAAKAAEAAATRSGAAGNNPAGKGNAALQEGELIVEKGDAIGAADRLRNPNATGGRGTTYSRGPSKTKPSNAVHEATKTQSKHLKGGKEMTRDMRRGRDAHVFADDVNLAELEELVFKNGDYSNVRGFDRWTYTTKGDPIGYRIQNGRDPVPLRTVEIKGKPTPDGGYKYHLVPRNRAAAPTTPKAPKATQPNKPFDPDATVEMPRVDPNKTVEIPRVDPNKTVIMPRAVSASRKSLDGITKQVWNNRDKFAGKGYRPVYKLYNQTGEPNLLTRPDGDYLDDIAKIARERPTGAPSNPQSGSYLPTDEALALYKQGKLDPAVANNLRNTFYRFERKNWKPESIRERVYINAKADTAPELMKGVVKRIIDDPAAYPGVEMAKISGPNAIAGRAENIVIYTSGPEATKKVLDTLQRVQSRRPQWFQNTTPAFTERVAPGLATGAEPVKFAGQESFGSVRAKAISEALEKTLKEGGDQAAFQRNVDAALRRYDVDPALPSSNLTGG